MQDDKLKKEEPPKPEQDELEALRQKCEEYLNGWKRSQADYQNLQKEQERRSLELSQFLIIGLVERVLPIVDHFEMALSHVPEEAKKQEWVQGFFHIKKQLDDFLGDLGVERMQSVGTQFNPHSHEAVATEPSDKAEGEIIKEARPGYLLQDKVIRPAKVVVAKAK